MLRKLLFALLTALPLQSLIAGTETNATLGAGNISPDEMQKFLSCEWTPSGIVNEISTENLDLKIQDENSARFSNLKISGCWFGKGLVDAKRQFVLFENCYFEDGVSLLNTVINTRVLFYNCAFGKGLVNGGRETLLQETSLTKPVFFKNCSFFMNFTLCSTTCEEPVTFDGCKFRGKVKLEQSAVWSAIRFSQCYFHDNVEFNVEANAQVALTGCIFDSQLLFQKSVISGGLDVSESVFNSGLVTEPAQLMLENVSIPSTIQMDNVSFIPGQAGQLKIVSSQIDTIRGLSWENFQKIYRAATGADHLAILTRLKASYDKLGEVEDSDHAFLEYKRVKASNVFEKFVNQFMWWSSGWGRNPSLLAGWLMFITFSFAILYYFHFCRAGRYKLKHGRWNFFLRCSIASFRMTLFQKDEAELFALIQENHQRGNNSKKLKDPVVELKHYIVVHQLCAVVVVAMISAYIASMLAG